MNVASLLNLPLVEWEAGKKFPNTCFGVEIELEDIRREPICYGFTTKEDGSLRNRGQEFVSPPWSFDTLSEQLPNLYTSNKYGVKNVSERCSVHVHLNCQRLSKEQLISLIKLYQVLERMLFAWIGDDRDKSIFCVPLHETLITYSLFESKELTAIVTKFKRWQKYTALNLLRLFDLGTVEFRHMAGQGSPERILQWLEIIGSIYEFIYTTNLRELDKLLLNLNTTSEYKRLIEHIFKEYSGYFNGHDYQLLLEEGVLMLKGMVLSQKEARKPPQTTRVELGGVEPLYTPRAELEDLLHAAELVNMRRAPPVAVQPFNMFEDEVR